MNQGVTVGFKRLLALERLTLDHFMNQISVDQLDKSQLVLFSGKGGVGKSTLSCTIARHWARQFSGEKVLLLSTDPAHSLGDVLKMDVSDRPQPLEDLPNLRVRALDAQKLLQTFREQYGPTLELLVERGSFVQGSDLQPVWDLGFPGLDELMSLLEIQRILRDGEADRVVVDMAPSGHTLNLFGLMDFLDNFLGALALFQEKHRTISQSFTGRYTADEADIFLQDMQSDLATGRALLQDPLRTACWVVAIAQPLSYLETGRFLTALKQLGIPVGGLFLNHLVSQKTELQIFEQQELLEKFLVLGGDRPILGVPQQTHEPVGQLALDQLFTQIAPANQWLVSSPQPDLENGSNAEGSLGRELPPSFLPLHPLPDFIASKKRLIIVGGKGGVGKTTVSAAIALGMAEQHPDQPVRVISIDPAHSLGDAVGYSLGHEPTDLTANLSAQELDAETILDAFRQEYLWELAEIMSGDTGDDALQIAYGPQAWRQIVSQALPGIDEMLSLIAVMEMLESGDQSLIVLDTAPTGHLLRFLEMPTALSDWLSWIFKLWLKYQDVVGRVDFMGRLRTLRQRVVQTQKKLKDPNHTEFIGVLQAQSAIVAEAERLERSLQTLGISQHYLIHNCYESGQSLVSNAFPNQTVVPLPPLNRVMWVNGQAIATPPLQQIQQAAKLLF